MDTKVILTCAIMMVILTIVDAKEAFVSTSEDLSLLPGNSTRLVCTGSRADLSFYIKNRIQWSVVFSNGTERILTEGFYADSSSLSLFEGDAPKYEITYQMEVDGYAFNLDVNDITHGDNGEYICSLLIEGKELIDKNGTMITVLNPIQKLTLEVHTMDHMNKYMSVYNYPGAVTEVMDSSTVATVMNSTEDVITNLNAGQYMILCVAEGSNPAPVVSLYHNAAELNITVNDPGTRSVNGSQVSYRSKVSVMDILFKSMVTEQLILCEANVPETGFSKVSAMFAFIVEPEKPDFVCTNLSSGEGDRYQEFVCTLTREEGLEHLTCDKVTWTIGESGHIIASEERFKDTEGEFDIMETRCGKTSDGLTTSLNFYLLNAIHFKTTFYVNYDMGKDFISHPVQVILRETSACSGLMPSALITLFICFISMFL